MTTTTRTYRLTTNIRPSRCGNHGPVRTVQIETLTVVDDGLRVDTHVTGTVEGTPVDSRSSKVWPGVSLDAAHEWRVRNGYVEIR